MNIERKAGNTEWLLLRLAIAVVAASGALYVYNKERMTAQDFALGKENTHIYETWERTRYTAADVQSIAELVENYRAMSNDGGAYQRKLVLWLGNSQLHTVNQYHKGDHLSPYWLWKAAACGVCLPPLGMSLPNANLQEHWVIAQYATQRLKASLIVVALVFDDLREDGLRDDFGIILSDSLRASMRAYPVGDEILNNYERMRTTDSNGSETAGLEGFVQKRIEDHLVKWIGDILPLWADRQNLRTRLLMDLYWIRNSVFGIKATTVRKAIKPRYDRNMRALEALLDGMRRIQIPVLLYVAPIRQDVPLPYDQGEYEVWKRQVETVAKANGAYFVNLESVVPAEHWGAYNEGQIDFMHFQGAGHELLARALLPEIEKTTALPEK